MAMIFTVYMLYYSRDFQMIQIIDSLEEMF